MTRAGLVGDRVAHGDRHTVGDFRVLLALLLPRGMFRGDGGAIDIYDRRSRVDLVHRAAELRGGLGSAGGASFESSSALRGSPRSRSKRALEIASRRRPRLNASRFMASPSEAADRRRPAF